MKYASRQEMAWAGAFGDAYINRNSEAKNNNTLRNFFTQIFQKTGVPSSVLELGANIGLNLDAINYIAPNAELHALEINSQAFNILSEKPYITAHYGSIADFKPTRTYDFVFTRGVLIHMHPKLLASAYNLLYEASAAQVMIAEYYNPIPMEVRYRQEDGLLFKRDFAGEFMTAYPDMTLDMYGFEYRGDPVFPQDDITWFLMSKVR